MTTSVNRPALGNHPNFFLHWPCRVLHSTLKFTSQNFCFLMLKVWEISYPPPLIPFFSHPVNWSQADAQNDINIWIDFFCSHKHGYMHVIQATAYFICPSLFDLAGQIVRSKELHFCVDHDSLLVELVALCVLHHTDSVRGWKRMEK